MTLQRDDSKPEGSWKPGPSSASALQPRPTVWQAAPEVEELSSSGTASQEEGDDTPQGQPCVLKYGRPEEPLETVTVGHFHPHSVALTVTAEGENDRLVGEGGLSSVRRELDL